MPRNMFLFNNAIYLLPYTGVGSGITRALDEDIYVTFMNNDKAQEFVITVWRGESNQVEVESNEVGNQVEEKSNQVEDLDTGLRHSDTDLDTGLRHSGTNLDTGLRHSGTDLDTKRVTLTNKEKDIVNFCSVPRTTKEILDRIGVSMHSKNRERYITSLVAAFRARPGPRRIGQRPARNAGGAPRLTVSCTGIWHDATTDSSRPGARWPGCSSACGPWYWSWPPSAMPCTATWS